MSQAPSKPRVAIIGTGGTISSLSDDSLDLIDYPDTSRKMLADEVLSRIGELDRFATCVPLKFRAVGSTAIGPTDWVELATLLAETEARDPGFAGYVITHGTATIEETAYFLHLTLKIAKPVVLVGAQRPASALSSDGAMNLVAAVRTAIEPAARGLGVLVVLNDVIHSAREVTKTSTYRLETFQSPYYGILGEVDGDRITIYRHAVRKHTADTPFRVDSRTVLPRVDIAYCYAGADSAAIDAFVAAGAKGLVSAALAPGIVTPGQRAALEKAAAAGIVVVQSSRAGSGRVSRRKYLREVGIVGADNLNPQKARVLLMLALTQTSDADTIQRWFAEY